MGSYPKRGNVAVTTDGSVATIWKCGASEQLASEATVGGNPVRRRTHPYRPCPSFAKNTRAAQGVKLQWVMYQRGLARCSTVVVGSP